LVLDPDHDGMSSRAELFLMLAARAQHVDETIRPALESGRVVLCDRYGDATYAYQHGGRGLDKAAVTSMHAFAADGCNPDMTFLLDLDPQAAKGRMATRPGNQTRIDAEKTPFHARVRAAYLERAKREPRRFRLLDASKSVGILQDRIQTAIRQQGVLGR
jgi:dTMP kinase